MANLRQPLTKLWYFAYGSNMSVDKFSRDRGISFSATARARVPTHHLAMSIPGLPYAEPAFATLESRNEGNDSKNLAIDVEKRPCRRDVIGQTYYITAEDFQRVVASEGGGTAYWTCEVNAIALGDADEALMGPSAKVWTLIAAIERRPCGCPSERYLNLICRGARESNLPDEYIEFLSSIKTYHAPANKRAVAGARLFLSMFLPVFKALELIIRANIMGNGWAPSWVIWLVREVLRFMWLVHDNVFAPFFGRGDGCDQHVV